MTTSKGMLIALLATLVWLGGWTGALAQDKSVNPGINKSFQNPNPATYVNTFEKDGREPYDKRNEILKACDLKPGMAVADIGAGTGLFARLFAKEVGPQGKVYAVDIAESFLEHIAKTAKEEGLTNLETVHCTQDSSKLPEASVNLVFICDVYHHFEFPQKTLASIHAALKPGGKLILIDFHRVEGVSSNFVMGHVRAGQEIFTSEIIAAGFKPIGEEKDLMKENYFVRFEPVAKPAESSADKPVEKPAP